VFLQTDPALPDIPDMIKNKETFNKAERLCSKKEIEALFENGKSFYSFPFVVVWSFTDSAIPFPAQMAISVSKKGFRLAVTRNLIKRRMRESWRKNKFLLYDFLKSSDKKIVFTIIYRESSVIDYFTIENSTKEMINKLQKVIGESSAKC
jgi:ribonuclease P protein component